jgi:hypothetical protein
MKCHGGLASCAFLLLFGAMGAPGSYSYGPDEGAVIVGIVGKYVRGDRTLEVNSDGTVVVRGPQFKPVHGHFMLKGEELTVTVVKDPYGTIDENTYCGQMKYGELNFGDKWWGHMLIAGKFAKK